MAFDVRKLTFDSLALTSHHNAALCVSEDGWAVILRESVATIISPTPLHYITYRVYAQGWIYFQYLKFSCPSCVNAHNFGIEIHPYAAIEPKSRQDFRTSVRYLILWAYYFISIFDVSSMCGQLSNKMIRVHIRIGGKRLKHNLHYLRSGSPGAAVAIKRMKTSSLKDPGEIPAFCHAGLWCARPFWTWKHFLISPYRLPAWSPMGFPVTGECLLLLTTSTSAISVFRRPVKNASIIVFTPQSPTHDMYLQSHAISISISSQHHIFFTH